MSKYSRGSAPELNSVKHKKLRQQIKKTEERYQQAVKEAAGTEYLLLEQQGYLEPSNELEQTYKLKQDELVKEVDVATKRKRFDLKLDQFGPYTIDYTRSGNSLLLGGSKGHVAAFDWKQAKLSTEINVKEHVRAVKWLQSDDKFFAVAQKKHTFIYDDSGMEVHCLKKHQHATCLEYLPYHFLLVSGCSAGFLTYQDVSTGKLVTQLRTKLGPTVSLCQNPYNAVIHAGHANGTVTLWAPNTPTPLVKMQNSRGPVRGIAIDRSGQYMAAASADCSVKVWDIRNTYQEVATYFAPSAPSSVSISDTGLLAVGSGSQVEVWKDALKLPLEGKPKKPYMKHTVHGSELRTVKFCPFEDVLGLGHKSGFSSMIVPGAGEANFDSLEVNPYMHASKSARREIEVKQLLNKLQPDMIALDPNSIGAVQTSAPSQRFASAAEKREYERNKRLENSKAVNANNDRALKRDRALQIQEELQEKRAKRLRGIVDNPEGAALDRFK